MGIDLVPSLRTLLLEKQQIRVCRWAFALVIIGLLLQLSSLVLVFSSMGGEEKPVEPEQIITRQSLFFLMAITDWPRAVVLLIVGALHAWVGRSERWRSAGLGLLLTILAELACHAIGLAVMGDSYSVKEGMPLGLRFALGVEQILRTLENWWIAVALAEFALACHDTILLGQSERLGYGVLASLLSVMALVGWTTPLTELPEDDFSQILVVAALASSLLVLVWLIQGIFRALLISRLLIAHLDQASRDSASAHSPDSGS
ncbi:hypothetical protein K2X85_01715 [bacterium]|jgi:hypothetical protein|nr:hypothetical protein [bacterium]